MAGLRVVSVCVEQDRCPNVMWVTRHALRIRWSHELILALRIDFPVNRCYAAVKRRMQSGRCILRPTRLPQPSPSDRRHCTGSALSHSLALEEEMLMKRIGIGALVVMMVAALCLSATAGKPVVQAHGELWTEIHLAGQYFDIQFAFSVKDRGTNDHGNISLRIFDHWTGKLVAVGISTDVFDVYQADDGWVYFTATFRVPRLDEDYYLPLHIGSYLFWARDGGGGGTGEFGMLGQLLPILKGKVTVK